MVVFLWMHRRQGWGSAGRVAVLWLAAGLLLAMTAASAQRTQEFLRWEERIVRGSRGSVVGPVSEVRPYAGGRLALSVGVDPVGSPSGWRIRLIAEPLDLVQALEAGAVETAEADHPGSLAFAARLYPALPAGNPGEFDRRAWSMARGYLFTAYLEPEATLDEEEDLRAAQTPSLCDVWPQVRSLLPQGLPWSQETAWRWRCALLAQTDPRTGAIMLAMALGQRDLIEPEWQDRFSRSGVAHLLAVSGLHVGFVLMFFVPIEVIMRRFTSPLRHLGWLLPLIGVAAFVALAGSSPSALRAGIVAGVALVARGWGRSRSSWQTLGLAGIAMLAWNPHYVVDLSFQLSFLATAGIIAFASAVGPLTDSIAAWRTPAAKGVAWLVQGLWISTAAQLVTTPLVAAHFSYISWLSPVTNVLAVPLGALTLLFTLSGLVLGEVIAPAGEVLLSLGQWGAQALWHVVDVASRGAYVEVPLFTPLMLIGWYAALVGAYLLVRGLARAGHAGLITYGRRLLLGGISVVVLTGVYPTVTSLVGLVEVWVLDVGQGDALLVRAPWGRHVLIDGGGVTGRAAQTGYDIGRERVVPTLRRLGVRRVDVIVNTHPHADHVQGLAAVIEQREVGRVFASWIKGDSVSYRRFVSAAHRRELEVEHFHVGDRIVLTPHVTFDVLAAGAPREWVGRTGQASMNNRSIALRLQSKRHGFLFLGDVEEAGVQNILARGPELTASGLVVPHHGGRLPSLARLLHEASPEVAVISAGANNPYGHPNAQTMETLEAYGVRVLRTDRHGAVRIRLWPSGLGVWTQRTGT